MRNPFCRTSPAPLVFASLVLIVLSAGQRQAFGADNVRCRPDLSSDRRQQFADSLREITGWSDVRFDNRDVLRFSGQPQGGSASARALLAAATSGRHLVVLEDASDRADVVFCRVVPGRWVRAKDPQPPAYVVLIDFTDFKYVSGDKPARAAFNTGWAVLHEIAHVVHDLPDGAQGGELGECEQLINRMRRECGLAERAEYFYTRYPGTGENPFITNLVRLAFVQSSADDSKKRRYWLIWDASLVGSGPARSAGRAFAR